MERSWFVVFTQVVNLPRYATQSTHKARRFHLPDADIYFPEAAVSPDIRTGETSASIDAAPESRPEG